jgi:uncharacterized membrane protein
MASIQAQQDADHLRILSIVHYVLGVFTALVSCFGLIYVVIGVLALQGKMPDMRGQEAQLFGTMFTVIGALVVLFGWSVALCQILTGRWLAARRHRTFCFVIACIECLNMPLGTALGVFTIIVMQRPSVRALFS